MEYQQHQQSSHALSAFPVFPKYHARYAINEMPSYQSFNVVSECAELLSLKTWGIAVICDS
jgi:hypothetical protein